MSDGPRYTIRTSTYVNDLGQAVAYAMILDRWYCYREVWRTDLECGGRGHRSGEAIGKVSASAVTALTELEAENEAWLAAC